MSTANRSARDVTDSGFLTLVIEGLRRSAALADQQARYGQRGERSRGAALKSPARAESTVGHPARSFEAPVVVTGPANRNVSARPNSRAAHSKHRFPSPL